MKRMLTTFAIPALGATLLTAASAQAQGVPPPNHDGSKTTYSMLAGSQLRSGDKLTDALLYSVWKVVQVKGTGPCSAAACPVQFNGETVYARRTRLAMSDGTASPSTPTTPGGVTKRRLERGDNGEDVRKLQEALNKEGAGLTVDSNYGRGTVAAVTAYQQKKGLTADGVAGRTTLQALGL